jgi:hypothetical protein
MNYGPLFAKATTRVAMAMALCALLGVVGCVTRPQAVMSGAGDVAHPTAPPIDPADNKCALFACEP